MSPRPPPVEVRLGVGSGLRRIEAAAVVDDVHAHGVVHHDGVLWAHRLGVTWGRVGDQTSEMSHTSDP